ncbi:MAG: AbrB/MazE/SpoVT family DNA-binding domain-containing protein [Phormidesmis sp.]
MTIQKTSAWGNSLGIRLPQAIARQVGFIEGALVSLSIEEDKLILTPASPT